MHQCIHSSFGFFSLKYTTFFILFSFSFPLTKTLHNLIIFSSQFYTFFSMPIGFFANIKLFVWFFFECQHRSHLWDHSMCVFGICGWVFHSECCWVCRGATNAPKTFDEHHRRNSLILFHLTFSRKLVHYVLWWAFLISSIFPPCLLVRGGVGEMCCEWVFDGDHSFIFCGVSVQDLTEKKPL